MSVADAHHTRLFGMLQQHIDNHASAATKWITAPRVIPTGLNNHDIAKRRYRTARAKGGTSQINAVMQRIATIAHSPAKSARDDPAGCRIVGVWTSTFVGAATGHV